MGGGLISLALSKATNLSQSQTISHILVQKAEELLSSNKLSQSQEVLEQSFRYSPSATAKILRLKIWMALGNLDKSLYYFLEFIKEDPEYLNFMLDSFDLSLELLGGLYPAYSQL